MNMKNGGTSCSLFTFFLSVKLKTTEIQEQKLCSPAIFNTAKAINLYLAGSGKPFLFHVLQQIYSE